MKQPSQPKAAATKHVILFLAANPTGTGRLALDREARSIHAELKRTGYRDRFEFVTRWAAEPLDLLREIRELKPTVVHFSGHGGIPLPGVPSPDHGRDVAAGGAPANATPHALCFHSVIGHTQMVEADAIAQTFGAAGASVRLVVLNACFTESIAEALLAHVDCVVGMTGAIHDDAARSFAIGFYGGLGEHESIAAAYEHGKIAIRLEGRPDPERPQLKVRPGFDASQLILAAAKPLVRVALLCPYPGMRPYSADEAETFHGRDAEIQDLLGRLRAGEREVYVIGPSGSGKSSLVAAGVLPRVARGIAGLGPMVVRTMRPGEQPATRLSEALGVPPGQQFAAEAAINAVLTHRGHNSSVLLVVDQLEELFTLANANERVAFLAALCALRAQPRCAVVVTLRADFFGALMESPLWPQQRRHHLSRIEVAPIRGELLREVIARPAHDVGVSVEAELIERLLADAASEPGVLPLLQEAMVQLWDKRAQQSLTLEDYHALGDSDRSGLAVALARRADATLRRFNTAHMDIARRILLRLISFGEGRSDTRRQQPLVQLRAAVDDAGEFAFVIQEMVDDRLLTMDDDPHGEPQVDLAHEIMITAWPALVDWIGIHRVDEQKRRRLEVVATEWKKHGAGIRGLLDSIDLMDAEIWQRTESARQLGHSAEVANLIAASKAAQRRHYWRRRGIVGTASTLLAVFIMVVVVLRRQEMRKEQSLRASLMQTAIQVSSTWSSLVGQFDANTNFLSRLKVMQEVSEIRDEADFGFGAPNSYQENLAYLHTQLQAYDWRMFSEIGGKIYRLDIAIADYKSRLLFSTAPSHGRADLSQLQLMSEARQKDRAIVLMHGNDAALAAFGINAHENELKLVYTRTLMSGGGRAAEARGVFIEIIDVAELLGQIGHDRNVKLSIAALDGAMIGDAPPAATAVADMKSETVRVVQSADNGATYYVASLPIRGFDNRVIGHIVLSNEFL